MCHSAATVHTGRCVRDSRLGRNSLIMQVKYTVNGRFGNAPTPWALSAQGAGNKCPESVHRFGLTGRNEGDVF